MYKILYNNQIIDVLDKIQYIKYLPKSKRTILVDKNQANGILNSNNNEIYHIYGTKNNFIDLKKSVKVIEITKEEYDKLTTQIQQNKDLETKVAQLEQLVLSLQAKLEGRDL